MGYIAKTSCSSTHCPRMKAFVQGTLNQMQINKSDALQDKMGNYWCSECYQRCDLIDYGHKHNWPNIETGGYAIGQGYDLWHIAIVMSRNECIDTIWHGVFEEA